MKIGIVDDHILFLSGVRTLLETLKYEVSLEANNGMDLIEKLKVIDKKNIPDIVLLDISMPVMDGFETADWLRNHYPEIKVIALTMQDDEQAIVKMVKKGVKAYLLKNINPAELSECIEKVYDDHYYFDPRILNIVLNSYSKPSSFDTVNESASLTSREIELLKLMATEMSYQQIADKLFISPRTLETHRNNIAEKLNLRTRTGMAIYAIKNKLIDL